MDELLAFLRERVAEDEAAAAAAPRGPWSVDDSHSIVDAGGARIVHSVNGGRLSPDSVTRAHVIRHDPARGLREVDAKRRILARHRTDPQYANDRLFARACIGCGTGGDCDDPNIEDINDCPELRDLAAVYADHPDFREEWRP